MFEDLRKSAEGSYEEEPEPTPEEQQAGRRFRLFQGDLLGMTAPQRFVVILMLLILTCVLGSFCLLLSGKVVLPF